MPYFTSRELLARSKSSKMVRHDVDLGDAHTATIIDTELTGVTIIDTGTGTFTLTCVFYDNTSEDLTSADLSNYDYIDCIIKSLKITNSSQVGLTLKLLIDKVV